MSRPGPRLATMAEHASAAVQRYAIGPWSWRVTDARRGDRV